MQTLAPIALFIYNRPLHTKQTLDALVKNNLANKSKLFIFCDGPKKEANKQTLNLIKEARIIAN